MTVVIESLPRTSAIILKVTGFTAAGCTPSKIKMIDHDLYRFQDIWQNVDVQIGAGLSDCFPKISLHLVTPKMSISLTTDLSHTTLKGLN